MALRAAAVILIGFVLGACSSDASYGGIGSGGTGGSGAAGAGGGSGGATGSGGTGGAAGNGSGGIAGGPSSPRTCMRFPAGCSCVEGDPSPDEKLCTTTSVVTAPDDVGLCCLGPVCECNPYICRNDATTSFCSCGVSTTITGVVHGDVVTTCPLPTGTQKCCISREMKSCTCSDLACPTGWQAVPSCALADITVCYDLQKVAACSTLTAGDGGVTDADAGGSEPDAPPDSTGS